MSNQTLAERLVAHPVWQRGGAYGWQRGMVDVNGYLFTGHDGDWMLSSSPKQVPVRSGRLGLPDIHNPGTQGHMMAALHQAASAMELHPWQLPMVVHMSRDSWCVRMHNDDGAAHFYAATKGDAIATALLWAFDRLVEQEAG